MSLAGRAHVAYVDPTLDVVALDLPASGLLSGVAAWMTVGVLHVGVPAAVILVSELRARRAAARALAADLRASAGGSLAPGLACVHGRIEVGEGSDHALRIEITQRGKNERSAGGFTHAWSETHRRVSALAFWVHDERGRVQIAADAQPLLVGELALSTRPGPDGAHRVRVAELLDGDEVYVAGELAVGSGPAGSAYRERERVLVMRPPRRERLLVSTAPLGDHFRGLCAGHRSARNGFVVLGLLFGLLDLGAWTRVVAGRVELATIVEATSRQSKNIDHCELVTELPDRQTVEVDADVPGCQGLEPGHKVHVTVVGPRWFAHVGSAPAVHEASLAISLLVLLFFAPIGHMLRDKSWRDTKLVELGDGKHEDAT